MSRDRQWSNEATEGWALVPADEQRFMWAVSHAPVFETRNAARRYAATRGVRVTGCAAQLRIVRVQIRLVALVRSSAAPLTTYMAEDATPVERDAADLRMVAQMISEGREQAEDIPNTRAATLEGVANRLLARSSATAGTCETCRFFLPAKHDKRIKRERHGACLNPSVLDLTLGPPNCHACDPEGMVEREFTPLPTFGCTLHEPAAPRAEREET